MARHGYGYEAGQSFSASSYSAPKLALKQQAQFCRMMQNRHCEMDWRLFLPRFKDRPFIQRRLCWYTDTPKGDFIVDYHPEYENLFIATGRSGHGFKFLPVLGRYIADSFEGSASEEQKRKWRAHL
ncbi:uncharacterized protein ASPGLDRAFT_27159 [Aspergillus glaucus CBS 516.65]|uniref:FAD dependent oxidoreductase domain-containing protein n=1 Tax=Aspergillus glaucus CBS 516.65 TaxID=1160497 RepID=A0A1L9VEG2_ASPGL|nr:hypothetical protein ASPGLDRAFT_27159 [Aspergillus glaucus CBS 516.65]OJJ82296.1 hypothetical protein ASPGLDRAFT_27159 [Aspergillus glaucus CBS 516.65]